MMPGWNITKKDLMLLCRDGRTLVILLMLPITFMYIIGKSVGTDEDNTKTPIAVFDNMDIEFDLTEFREFSPESFDMDPDDLTEDLPPVDEEELADLAAFSGITVEELKADLQSEIQTVQKNARMITDRIIEKLKRHKGMTVTMLHSAEEVEQFKTENHDKIVVEIGDQFWNKTEKLSTKDFFSQDEGTLSEGLKGIDMILHPPRIKNSTREAAVDTFVLYETYSALSPYIACKKQQFEAFVGKSTCKPYGDNEALPDLPEILAKEEPENEDQLNELFVFVVPGFTVMFMFFLVNIMARSFLQEKQQGTLQRLQIAPMAPSSVLIGKTVPFFLISLVQTLLLFLFGKLAFDMHMGSDMLMLGVVIILTSLSVVGLGLIVAVLVKTDAQVSSYANFIVIMMAGVSGCFIPSDWISDPFLSFLKLGTPHHWALQGMRELISAEVPNMALVGESCMVLAAFSVCFFVFGTIFWRNRTAA